MLCRAIPYEGREPYIFFSYSHKDAERVYPLLEQMVRDGYRVWYDDGNHPGDDWLENIGQHLSDCDLCLAMMSQNSEESHNCKKEVSFAVQCNKKLMAVMLEQFAMTVGMRLQLSTIHYLRKADYPSDKALLEKLYETDSMQACRSLPGSLPMRDVLTEGKKVVAETKHQDALAVFTNSSVGLEQEKPAETEDDEQPAAEDKAKTLKIKAKVKLTKKDKMSEKTATIAFAQQKLAEDSEDECEPLKTPLQNVPENERKTPVADKPHTEDAGRTASQEQHEEDAIKPIDTEQTSENTKTDAEEETVVKKEMAESKPLGFSNEKKVLLVRTADGSSFISDKALIHIGRSEKRCDIVLKNNHLISNHHASVVIDDDICYLMDAGSSNGTFINEERLQPGVQMQVSNIVTFQIGKEEFLLFYGEAVEKCWAERSIAYLRNPATNSARILDEKVFLLDRQHKWEDGSLSNGNISRKHARICADENGYHLEDLGSKNGTYCNEQKISPQIRQQLVNGDRIRLVDTVLEFHIVTF